MRVMPMNLAVLGFVYIGLLLVVLLAQYNTDIVVDIISVPMMKF